MNYFAYGSNLHPVRLAERIGAVVVRCVGVLHGARLRFNKIGRDGSGKCNFEDADDPRESVFGVVWCIDSRQKEILDDYESLGAGYAERAAVVACPFGRVKVFTYAAMSAFISERIRPFEWYRDLVQVGAEHWGFPADYRRRIAQVLCVADPDDSRADGHRRLLEAARRCTTAVTRGNRATVGRFEPTDGD